MTPTTTDVALQVANEALHRIDKHEAVCTQRWINIKTDMESATAHRVAMKGSIDRLYTIIWKAVIGLITVLIGVVGALLAVVVKVH